MGTVALVEDGQIRSEVGASVRAAHGETLLPHVRDTLRMARVDLTDVDLFAVGLGPGSFTGLRIGVATAKGLALAGGQPLVGVCTLRTLARGMPAVGGLCCPLLDAYKGEVYGAAYSWGEAAELRTEIEPFHGRPEAVLDRLRTAAGDLPIWVAGDGVSRYAEVFERLPTQIRRAPGFCDAPRAACLAHEAALLHATRGPDDLAALEPMYLRASDARLPSTPQRR